MSGLKPCPFCGYKSKIVQCDDEGNVRGEKYESNPWSGLGYRVVHESDDCPISTSEDGYNLIYDSQEEAESHWNRRANECDRDELLALAEEIDANGDALLADTSLLVGSVGLMRCYAESIRKALGVE